MKPVNRELDKTKALKELLLSIYHIVYIPEKDGISKKECQLIRDEVKANLEEFKTDFETLKAAWKEHDLLNNKKESDFNLRKYFERNLNISSRYIDLFLKVGNSPLEIDKKLSERSFLPGEDNMWSDFDKIKNNKKLPRIHLEEKLDFYSIYRGFRGYKDAVRYDFSQEKKKGKELNEPFSDELTSVLHGSKKIYSKELESLINSYLPPSIEILNSSIVRTWNKLKWLLGFRSWCYNWGGNPPFGLDRQTVRARTANYISADFQRDSFVYEKGKERQEDVLGELYKSIFERTIEAAPCAYHFVFASSGIGKTSLILRLLVEVKRRQYSEKKVYAIPFASWKKLTSMKLTDKLNAVLFLDAMDEDFSLSSPEEIENVVDDLRETTKDFNQVIITSRGEFFQENKVMELFTRDIGEFPDFEYTVSTLCPFSDGQVEGFVRKAFTKSDNREKARNVIQLIGTENLNRQLLISNIQYLYDFLDSKYVVEDCREYMLFDHMLKKWLKHERSILNKILKGGDHKRSLESTYEFSKALAKLFFGQEKGSMLGFSFNEIIDKLSTEFDQSKLLVNRTFLIRDVHDRYRFAHQSIYDFFTATAAVEDEAFDSSQFQKSINQPTNEVNISFYNQAICFKLVELIRDDFFAEILNDIRIINQQNHIEDYQNDILIKLHSDLIPSHRKDDVCSKSWADIVELVAHPSSIHTIKGIIFSNESGVSKKTLELKRIFLKGLNGLFRFMTNLKVLGVSNLGLTNTELMNLDLRYVSTLDISNNRLEEISIEREFDSLNLRGNVDINVTGQIKSKVTVIDFHNVQGIFKGIKSQESAVYIFIGHEDFKRSNLEKILIILVFLRRHSTSVYLATPNILIDCTDYTNVEGFTKLTGKDNLDTFQKHKYFHSLSMPEGGISIERIDRNQVDQHNELSGHIRLDIRNTRNVDYQLFKEVVSLFSIKIHELHLGNYTSFAQFIILNRTVNFELNISRVSIDKYSSAKDPDRLKGLKKGDQAVSFRDLFQRNKIFKAENPKVFSDLVYLDEINKAFAPVEQLSLINFYDEGELEYFSDVVKHLKLYFFDKKKFELSAPKADGEEVFNVTLPCSFKSLTSLFIHSSFSINIDIQNIDCLKNLKETQIESQEASIQIFSNNKALQSLKNIEKVYLKCSHDTDDFGNQVTHLNIDTIEIKDYLNEDFFSDNSCAQLSDIEIWGDKNVPVDVFSFSKLKPIQDSLIHLKIFYPFGSYTDYKLLSDIRLRSLALCFFLPISVEKVWDLIPLIESINKSSTLETVELIFCSRIRNHVEHESISDALIKILSGLNKEVVLDIVLYDPLTFESLNPNIRFNLRKLKESQILEVLAPVKKVRLSEKELYSYLFPNYYRSIEKYFLVEGINFEGVTLSPKLLEKKSSALFSNKLTRINDEFFKEWFLNGDLQPCKSLEMTRRVFHLLPISELKLINVDCDVAFYFRMYNLKTLHLNSIEWLYISFRTVLQVAQALPKGQKMARIAPCLTKIIALKHYMNEEEKAKIPEYKQFFEVFKISFEIQEEPCEVMGYEDRVILELDAK